MSSYAASQGKEVVSMTTKLFDPGPKMYTYLLDRLNRRIDLKYRDYSTALDSALRSTLR